MSQQSPTSNEEPLIRVENVGKIFCRDLKKSLWYGAKDSARDLLSFGAALPECSQDKQLRNGEFWANKDISFELRRGECLGLIGRNGAGKTTLLKMLNGLIKPDVGTITMRGRVGALIALGAGFNPILTGRENVYVNGSVLGLTKREIDEKFDEITDFAELEEFIDAPVQSYSSGMKVRLGFSVAVNLLVPDVLLLDEVLAVGDAAFRAKCEKRISELLQSAAVIFVSHNSLHISRICDRVLWLEKGKVRAKGPTQEHLEEYEKSYDMPANETKLTCVEAIREVRVSNFSPPVKYGDSFYLELELTADEEISAERIVLGIVEPGTHPAAQGILDEENVLNGKTKLRFRTDPLFLRDGRYLVNIAIYGENHKEFLLRLNSAAEFTLKTGIDGWAIYRPKFEISKP